MRLKAKLLDEQAVSRALNRIAHEIIERNDGIEDIAIVGIKTRGVPLAKTIAENIMKVENEKVSTGILDISLYRDDVQTQNSATINSFDIDFEVEGKIIILVDDVLFTGRTVRAAIDAVMKKGRPKCIQLAVLIDRGHRELPIKADYVGKNVPTSRSEIVSVNVKEKDGEDSVLLYDLNE